MVCAHSVNRRIYISVIHRKLYRSNGLESFSKCIPDKKKKTILTAAIDFGTTYSGYAFSFAANPKEVFTFNWKEQHVKTPSVIMLDSDWEPDAFGYEAEQKYVNLLNKEDADGYYYFEKFKMQLYNITELQKKELNRDMEIEDIKGKKAKAIIVFSGALKYLKNHLLTLLNQRKEKVAISSADIHWILTVPAIWNDGSKQFMRDAAEMAGIPSDLLTLALEPEAAAIYCILGANEFFMGLTQSQLPLIKESTKYILLDLGGGTGDIACHELTKDGVLKELHEPTGGDFGGITVDNEFRQCLRGLLGMKVLKHFQEHYTEDYLELFESFERKKCTFDDTRPEVMFHISSTFCQSYKDINNEDLNSSLQNSPKRHLVEIRGDKFVINAQLMKRFFEKSISLIQLHIQTLLDNLSSAGISQLLMVGGFSESKYVQKVLKEYFGKRIEIIIPGNPAAAVVKGAVYFGHNPGIISKRVCRYTYGIARMMRFKKEVHPPSKLKIIEGVAYVDDIFSVHIRRGDIVELEQETATLSYYPAMAHIKQVILPVYASVHPNPTYIDEEGCRHVGNVIAELSEFANTDQMELLVKLTFGGTEIKVELREKSSGRIVEGSVEFLG
ncbi:hypothetical protein ACJMK2_030825 [Sinanodonta woodiana]|uniref:Heat shock 70 kDa protein 12A n=1 Tax=Sinanodonta woodiana TaxID=1069815 RepID=A0ABD3WWZ0_SINWO